jgi:tetratricopeptide (TPR) repeat protein
MHFFSRQIFLLLVFLTLITKAGAQGSRPSPEVRKMYDDAQDNMDRHNFPGAELIYKQAIKLDPQNTALYQGLARAFYYEGKYNEAAQTLEPVLTYNKINDTCYQLLAASLSAQRKDKEASRILRDGLNRFKTSGLLYNQQGILYKQERKEKEALASFVSGITADAACAANYRDAGEISMHRDRIMAGLLYTETYLAITHDTTGDEAIKTRLLGAYKSMFAQIAGADVPKYGAGKTDDIPKDFAAVILYMYSHLTPVVSDGMTVSNLVMVRTRFLLEWSAKWKDKYPCTLFSYQDQLLRTGQFDKYNEWLFGKAINTTEFDAWNKFHDGELSAFVLWRQSHPLIPAGHEGDYFK